MQETKMGRRSLFKLWSLTALSGASGYLGGKMSSSTVQSPAVLKRSDGAQKIGRGASSVDADLTDIEVKAKAPFIAQFYDQVSLKEFAGGDKNQGASVDMTTALNAAIADLSNSKFKLLLENGEYYFNSRPNDINKHMQIVGAGRGKTFLHKNWASTANDEGIFNFRDGSENSRVSNLTAYATVNSQSNGAGTGCIISAVPNVGSVDGLQLRDLWLSSQAPAGQAYTHSNIHINGEARSAAPIGVRDTIIENCALFGGEEAAAILRGVVAMSINGGGTFGAGGKTGRLKITGSPEVNSYYVDVNMQTFNGAFLTNTRFVNLKGYSTGEITNASSAQYCLFLGQCTSQIQEHWTNSRAILSDGFSLSKKQKVLGGVNISPSTAYTQAHNLGSTPELITAKIQCTSADIGYSVGDGVDISANQGITFFADASNIKYTTAQNIQLVNRASGSIGNIDFAKWALIVNVFK